MTDGYAIFEVKVPPQWDKKKIFEIDVRKQYGINILGIRNGRMDMNPSFDRVLHKEETMMVLGKHEQLQRLFHL